MDNSDLFRRYGFDPQVQARAKALAVDRANLALVYHGLAMAAPLLLALVSGRLFSALAELIPWAWLLALLFTFLVLLGAGAFYPLLVWLHLRLESNYAPGSAWPRRWAARAVQESFLLSLAGIIPFAFIYGLAEPAWQAADWDGASFLLLYFIYSDLRLLIFSGLLEGKTAPAGEEVQARTRELAKTMKLKAPKVMEMVSPGRTLGGAMYSQWLFFERIVISSNLRAGLTAVELDAVLAHELAHKRQIWGSLLCTWSRVFLALPFIWFGLPRLAALFGFTHLDIASLPLFIFLCEGVCFLGAPLTNAISRWVERRADLLALNTTQNPEAFASAMVKLHDHNLLYALSSRGWKLIFNSHPTGIERVEQARQWRAPVSRTEATRK